MVQHSTTQLVSRRTRPALIWIAAVEIPVLRTAARGFGFAADEDDLEQALADYRAAACPAAAAPKVAAEDFERLYGWFLA